MKVLGRKQRWALAIALFVLSGCQSIPAPEPGDHKIEPHAAVTPADRAHVEWWIPRHEQVLERIKQGNVDLVMLGDSITHGWERNGKAVWDQYYGSRNAVNMGFSGDRTQHVLWRLQHGEIDGISPKLAVLMIGTNNSNGDSATHMADGIKAICAELRSRLPETKILILGIFPRAQGNGDVRERIEHAATYNDQWATNDEASRLASAMSDNRTIYYLNINEQLLDENGALTRDVMPDLLHLNAEGYGIWAAAMEPTVRALMGD